jgi:cytochrome c oxidase subunit II
MLDFLYLSGWGAFAAVLLMLLPFALVFLYVIYKKSVVDPTPSTTDSRKYVRAERLWIGLVVLVFVGLNVASIDYMPTVATAKAMASGHDVTDIELTAQSWSYDIAEETIQVGHPVRFLGKSSDTMHSFAVYHPDGDVLFTMMLMPGLDAPTFLIHTFTEAGTYTVRCLEYCGLMHHEMRDEIVVVEASS